MILSRMGMKRVFSSGGIIVKSDRGEVSSSKRSMASPPGQARCLDLKGRGIHITSPFVLKQLLERHLNQNHGPVNARCRWLEFELTTKGNASVYD